MVNGTVYHSPEKNSCCVKYYMYNYVLISRMQYNAKYRNPTQYYYPIEEGFKNQKTDSTKDQEISATFNGIEKREVFCSDNVTL